MDGDDGWVQSETASADFGDARLDARLGRVVEALGRRPTASVAVATGSRNDMEAAYAFFANPRVTPDAILRGHHDATHRRIAGAPRVILVQDTTEVEVTRPRSVVAGSGPLDGGTRRGGLLHPLVAFTPDGTPLGTVAVDRWARDDPPPGAEPRTRADRARTPIDGKESRRWVGMLREAHRVAARHPATAVVCVADSEADVYEVLVEGGKAPGTAGWVVRACQDRALAPAAAGGDGATLVSRRAAQPVLFERAVAIRGREPKVAADTRARRQPRVARTATLEVRAGVVTLRPPWRPGVRLPEVTVNVVWVTERDAPAGDVPVEWVLLTNLPIEGAEAVRVVVESYCQRWMIEVFFRVLKSGCRLEARRFEAMDRVWNFAAVCLVVAWRTLYVCRLGRALPDVSCEAVFDPSEWQSVYRVVTGKPPPAVPPRLRDMVRMVAVLGGYVSRGKGSEPGPDVIWKGLQRMRDYADAWELFGPGAKLPVR
jgi:transposase-like protein/transposase Tn5 family protein